MDKMTALKRVEEMADWMVLMRVSLRERMMALMTETTKEMQRDNRLVPMTMMA
jgi:hypothetical protein